MHGWFMQNSEVRNTHNTLAICRMSGATLRINPMRGSTPTLARFETLDVALET
jgi:hypothetical protein